MKKCYRLTYIGKKFKLSNSKKHGDNFSLVYGYVCNHNSDSCYLIEYIKFSIIIFIRLPNLFSNAIRFDASSKKHGRPEVFWEYGMYTYCYYFMSRLFVLIYIFTEYFWYILY